MWRYVYLVQENYLPFMIRGKLKQLLLGDGNHQDLFKFVDTALQSSVAERKAVLEVSAYYICTRNFLKYSDLVSKFTVHICFITFAEKLQ